MRNYIKQVNQCLESLDLVKLETALKYLDLCSKNENRIFIIGNGGSAALASHFCIDLIKSGYIRGQRIYANSLVDNLAVLTATSNDFDFDQVFSWQLQQEAKQGDLLFTISSSGNSNNIIRAIETAQKMGLRVISLSGFDGGLSAKISDISLITISDVGNYGPVEDSHSVICHYLALALREF